MIVNINPRVADYEETVNVLLFAKMAQEVEIERRDRVLPELAATPAAHMRNAQGPRGLCGHHGTRASNISVDELNPDYNALYSLGPYWSSLEWQGPDDKDTLSTLWQFLDQRLATWNTLVQNHVAKRKFYLHIDYNDLMLNAHDKTYIDEG